jgi:DNA-binding NarL/FixJ family response regulator
VARCSKHETLLEELVKDPPQVVVYCLRADWREDIRVLRLVRRIAPQMPLVILGPVSSLEIREEVQGLRPIYFGVTPVEQAELEGAVQAAADRSR